MTNAMCAGEQDRNSTTSSTSPNIPPSKTKYCYLEGEFNRSDCGTSGEKACNGKGGPLACIPDNYGGYCKDTDKQIYFNKQIAYKAMNFIISVIIFIIFIIA